MQRGLQRSLYHQLYKAIFHAELPLQDVSTFCKEGEQRCHRCDDLVCCDNMWMSDLQRDVEKLGVDSNEAQFLYTLQRMGVRVGRHDRQVTVEDFTLVGKV